MPYVEMATSQGKTMDCVFCNLPPERIERGNEYAFVIRDAYPISAGHSLIIPRRHIPSFFDLQDAEREGLIALLQDQKASLDASLEPDGYNIGINDGPAAGQTVSHLHIHLIPRYLGDQEDPRGGVRWIFPDLADYWSKP